MADRTISFATYTTDGEVNTTVTPTVTVSYAGGSATSLTPTANGSLWNVTVDDTQDATLLISGAGLATDHLIVLRRDLPVAPTSSANATAVRSELSTELGRLDAAVSTRLASAGYTAPDNAGIAAIDSKVAALNDLSAADVGTALTTYGTAKTADIPTDYATALAVAAIPTNPLLADDYTAPDNAGITSANNKIDALNDISTADVAAELTAYGTAKATDIPTDYAKPADVQVTVPAPVFDGTVEVDVPAPVFEGTVQFAGTVEVPAPIFDGTVTIDPPVALQPDERAKLMALDPLTAEETTAAVEAATIPVEADLTPVLTAIEGIPAATDAVLSAAHGVGLWGAALATWVEITEATLDVNDEPLGTLDAPDVLLTVFSGATPIAATRSEGDGEFSVFVPPGSTYTIRVSRSGYTYPERTVSV